MFFGVLVARMAMMLVNQHYCPSGSTTSPSEWTASPSGSANPPGVTTSKVTLADAQQ
jgi:hypothetical protein